MKKLGKNRATESLEEKSITESNRDYGLRKRNIPSDGSKTKKRRDKSKTEEKENSKRVKRNLENTTKQKAKNEMKAVKNSQPETGNSESKDLLSDQSKSYNIKKNILVTDFLTRPFVQTGFDRGLQPEQILGATNYQKCLYLVIKFYGDNEPQLIESEVANKEIPQMVIKFYEDCVSWDSDDVE